MSPENKAIRELTLDPYASVIVAEPIQVGDVVAIHPHVGMLFGVYRGCTVAGIAMDDLAQGDLADFNIHVGHFKRRPGPKVYKCNTCKDGEDTSGGWTCEACGSDWIPF